MADPCSQAGAVCSWPEVLGTDFRKAIDMLENSTAKLCIPVPSGSVVVTNYDPNRIYVWYDPANDTVIRVPEAG
jgi:Potato inhibitor I family